MLCEIAPQSAVSQHRLRSTYYDNRELALRQRGLTLRVREQDGRFIQTVKAGDLAGPDILARGEWEDALADSRPDPRAPRSGARLPQLAADDLQPLFATDVTRTTLVIEPAAGVVIEAAIDEGEIRALCSDAVEPISEIELELRGGDAVALYDLALRLLQAGPLRIETRSKSERGYGLVEGGAAYPRTFRTQPVALDRGGNVDAALRNIGRLCLAQLLRNEAAVLSAQPDGVHQMRVAVRRLRSAVASLKQMLPAEQRNQVEEDLAWLGGALGAARNLDVFATELLPAARTGVPDDPGWDELAAVLDRLRRAAYDRVRETIASQRYTAGMLRLLRWFEGRGRHDISGSSHPVGEIAPRILDRRRRKARRRSKGFGHLTPRERHELRIATKKLRYTIDLFGSLFDGREGQKYVNKLKRLQNELGYANDVRVAHEFVCDLFAQIEPRSPAARAWISLLEWHDLTGAGRERKLRKQVRRLNAAAPFWRA